MPEPCRSCAFFMGARWPLVDCCDDLGFETLAGARSSTSGRGRRRGSPVAAYVGSMLLGVHCSNLSWPGGAEALGPTLAGVARAADAGGFTTLTMMDHY